MQWWCPKGEIPKEDKVQLIGRMLEIGIRVMFRNLIYSFGGEQYLQEEGGPIGMRGTCAVSKLVTRDFCKKLRRILEEGGINVRMLEIYVDDGRIIVSYVERGAVYNKGTWKIEYTAEQEVEVKEREEGGKQ